MKKIYLCSRFARSSNGRTSDFGSDYVGSNPARATQTLSIQWQGFFYKNMDPLIPEEEKDKQDRRDLLHKALTIEQSLVLTEVAGELTKLAYPESFQHLLNALLSQPGNSSLLESVKTFAGTVAMEDPCSQVLSSLAKPGTNHLQVPLLSWCWEFAWDCSGHLPGLCELACKSDMEACIEILTIADNMKNVPPQEEIVKSMIILRNGMHGPDENKNALLSALMETINNY